MINIKKLALTKSILLSGIAGGIVVTVVLPMASCGHVTDISEIITITELGELDANTGEAIQSRIINLNPKARNISWDQLRFLDITPTSAHIIAKANSDYTGSVDVTFTILPDIDYNADGTNWPGYISGSLSYSINSGNNTYTITGNNWQTDKYTAVNLRIPNTIVINHTSYTVVEIGNNAFASCETLTGKLTLPNNLITIGATAFNECHDIIGPISFPDTLVSIGNNAFSSCSGFTGGLTFPASITSIGDTAFEYCTGFTGNLIFNSSTVTIGAFTFSHCSGFNNIVCSFPNEPVIGRNAFDFLNANGTVLNTNTNYASSALCTFLKTKGLPNNWTVSE